jgi:hypothetical protein
MLLATPVSWINRRLLSLPPLVFIGRVSYSWYLWHWPLLAFIRIPYGDAASPPLAVTLPLMALAFGIAVLSYYWIEQPFRSSRRAPGPLLLRYAAVSFAFLVVFAVVDKSHGFPARFPRLARMEAVNAMRGFDRCLAYDGVDQPNLSAQCVGPLGNGSNGASVALWGDSHSGAMAPGMRAIVLKNGYNFLQLGKVGCLPLLGAVRFTPAQPAESPECLRFNEKTLQVIKSDTRIKLVILSGYWANVFRPDPKQTWLTPDLAQEREIPTLEETRVLFERSLTETIRTLEAAGKQVLVLGDTPSFEVDPIARVAITEVPVERLLARWLKIPNTDDPGYETPNFVDSDQRAAAAIAEVLAATPGVALAEVKSALCKSPSECYYRDRDNLLYADSHHLTPDGASFALREFQLPSLSSTGK